MLIASRRSGQPVCPAPPLAPRPPGTLRCLRNSAPFLRDRSRVIVAPMARRESLSSRPLPDAGCRFARLRSRNGNKKGGRSRCRGSKNKKYCKTRRKLRGPTPKLAASGQAPCVGPSASGAIATSIPDAAGSRRASNAGRRPASTSASNVRRATDPRSPCALTPAWRGCAGRQIKRANKTAKKRPPPPPNSWRLPRSWSTSTSTRRRPKGACPRSSSSLSLLSPPPTCCSVRT